MRDVITILLLLLLWYSVRVVSQNVYQVFALLLLCSCSPARLRCVF